MWADGVLSAAPVRGLFWSADLLVREVDRTSQAGGVPRWVRHAGGRGSAQLFLKKLLDRFFQSDIVNSAVSDSMTWLGSSVGRAED